MLKHRNFLPSSAGFSGIHLLFNSTTNFSWNSTKQTYLVAHQSEMRKENLKPHAPTPARLQYLAHLQPLSTCRVKFKFNRLLESNASKLKELCYNRWNKFTSISFLFNSEHWMGYKFERKWLLEERKLVHGNIPNRTDANYEAKIKLGLKQFTLNLLRAWLNFQRQE